MKILKTSIDCIDEKIINEAINVLADGGVVLYPTDTVYGIGCSVFDKTSIKTFLVIVLSNFIFCFQCKEHKKQHHGSGIADQRRIKEDGFDLQEIHTVTSLHIFIFSVSFSRKSRLPFRLRPLTTQPSSPGVSQISSVRR